MHQTWESLRATLDAGRTPCGDDAEDGSGRGTCGAADGSVAVYTYRRTDKGYAVLTYDRVR